MRKDGAEFCFGRCRCGRRRRCRIGRRCGGRSSVHCRSRRRLRCRRRVGRCPTAARFGSRRLRFRCGRWLVRRGRLGRDRRVSRDRRLILRQAAAGRDPGATTNNNKATRTTPSTAGTKRRMVDRSSKQGLGSSDCCCLTPPTPPCARGGVQGSRVEADHPAWPFPDRPRNSTGDCRTESAECPSKEVNLIIFLTSPGCAPYSSLWLRIHQFYSSRHAKTTTATIARQGWATCRTSREADVAHRRRAVAQPSDPVFR